MSDIETQTFTLTEAIIEAIVANGGMAEDIQYLSDKAIRALGLHLAQAGIEVRNPNPSFVVDPVNDIGENMEDFDWAYSHLSKLKFKVEGIDGPQTVELIRCKPGYSKAVLREIKERGFIPALSSYVLGLGLQHPAIIKKYGWITSLDEQNVLLDDEGDPSFLSIYWDAGNNLDLVERAGEWDERCQWWFAVIRVRNLNLVL